MNPDEKTDKLESSDSRPELPPIPTAAPNDEKERSESRASMLDHARMAMNRGFAIFPCKPRTKIPATEHGFKNASTNWAHICKWWITNPNFNVGIAGGASNIAVLDADHGFGSWEQAEEWRVRNGLPATYAVRTGRRPEFGVQWYFTGQTDDGNWELDNASGQIKSRGGYVMAAGCIHPDSGERYEVLADLPLAALPEEFLNRVRKAKARDKAKGGGKPRPEEKITENRNIWLTSQAGRLVNAGLSGQSLRAAIFALNQEHCEPPLSEEELENTILASAERNFEATLRIEPADVIAQIDAWLNDPAAAVPSREEVIATLALCAPLDFEERRKRLAERLGVTVPGLKKAIKENKQAAKKQQPRPPQRAFNAIYLPGRLNECVRIAENALNAIGGKYYEHNSRLVMPRYARDLVELKSVERAGNSVLLVGASEPLIRRDLDERVVFRFSEDPNEGFPIMTPGEVPGHILDRVATSPRDVPYPTIDMITNTPVLLPSGAVHDANGEFREGVLFVASDQEFPVVKFEPSRDDAIAALKQFEPLFEKFPFVDEQGEEDGDKQKPWNKTSSYAVALAACLTIAARPVLRVSVPLFGVKAPVQRSGKTKIVETISNAMLGHKPTTMSFNAEEEFEKHLLPVLLQQDRAVLIDNLQRPLHSSKLAINLTSNRYNDRILGESKTVCVTNRSVFFATGNNLIIAGDLAVRALLVSINPNVERPEERHFDFEPTARALERHPKLVVGALTALRAFILAGRPWELKRALLGGFEEWDQLISGTLGWLGYADPAATRAGVIDDDPEREQTTNLLRTWHLEFGTETVSLGQIKEKPGSQTRELLLKDGVWDARRAAWLLRRLRDRVVSGLKLVKSKGPGGGERYWWRVVIVQDEPTNSSDAPRASKSERELSF